MFDFQLEVQFSIFVFTHNASGKICYGVIAVTYCYATCHPKTWWHKSISIYDCSQVCGSAGRVCWSWLDSLPYLLASVVVQAVLLRLSRFSQMYWEYLAENWSRMVLLEQLGLRTKWCLILQQASMACSHSKSRVLRKWISGGPGSELAHHYFGHILSFKAGPAHIPEVERLRFLMEVAAKSHCKESLHFRDMNWPCFKRIEKDEELDLFFFFFQSLTSSDFMLVSFPLNTKFAFLSEKCSQAYVIFTYNNLKFFHGSSL